MVGEGPLGLTMVVQVDMLLVAAVATVAGLDSAPKNPGSMTPATVNTSVAGGISEIWTSKLPALLMKCAGSRSRTVAWGQLGPRFWTVRVYSACWPANAAAGQLLTIE